MNITRYIGVDGCKAGWFFVNIDSDGKFDFGIMDKFSPFVTDNADNCLYLIDIPIGLPSREKPIRHCDREARHLLGPHRHNSVFSPPCSETLETKDYDNACKINKAITGRKISRQAWGIGQKIREIGDLGSALDMGHFLHVD